MWVFLIPVTRSAQRAVRKARLIEERRSERNDRPIRHGFIRYQGIKTGIGQWLSRVLGRL